MNRTELKVYIDGVWHDVDINDKIAINYQWYDLNDTSLRYVPYSQSLNIPLTQRNSKTFKHCNRFDSTTDILRRFIPTKLFEDGIKIADGYMNILSASLKNLEVNVVSSADFFYLLKQKDAISGKQKTLNDLDWTDEILRSTSSFLANKDNKDIFFAVADFDKGDDNNKSLDVRNHIFYPENQKPFVWFDSIMNKILSENGGYTLISGVQTDRLSVPLASINKKYNVDDELCKGISVSTISRVINEGTTQLESVLNAPSSDPNKISISTEGIKLQSSANHVLRYECEITGTYVFSVNFNTAAKITSTIYDMYLGSANSRAQAPSFGDGVIYGAGFTVANPYAYFSHNIVVRKNSEAVYTKSAIGSVRTVDTTTATTTGGRGGRDNPDPSRQANRTGAPIPISPYYSETIRISISNDIISLELKAGDVLTFEHSNYYEKTGNYAQYSVGTPFLYIGEVTKFDVDLTYIKPKVGVVPMGINIPIKDNMPEMTQYDFMMSYFNMYGLIPFADKIDKKIYAYNMRSIIDNKVNNFYDWSDKYVKDTGEFTTSIESYGKKSYIKYKDVSRNVEGEGDVVINEETAEQLFNKGIIIKYYQLESSTNFELISNLVDSFVSGAYKYLTLAAVVDEANLTIKDEAYIVCDDDSLESEKDIIEIGFNANEIFTAKDYVDAPFSYAKFRDGADNVLAVYKNPRIVVINRGYILLAECAAEGVSNQMKLVQVASSYNTDAFEQVVTSIDMNNLIDNYKPLQDNILSDVKYITGAQFALNKLDIEALNPYIPIYVEAFGAMFYVNKINNYLPDTLVSVDLIKI